MRPSPDAFQSVTTFCAPVGVRREHIWLFALGSPASRKWRKGSSEFSVVRVGVTARMLILKHLASGCSVYSYQPPPGA